MTPRARLTYWLVLAAYLWSIGWSVAGLPFALVEGVLNFTGRLPLWLLDQPIPVQRTENAANCRPAGLWAYAFFRGN